MAVSELVKGLESLALFKELATVDTSSPFVPGDEKELAGLRLAMTWCLQGTENVKKPMYFPDQALKTGNTNANANTDIILNMNTNMGSNNVLTQKTNTETRNLSRTVLLQALAPDTVTANAISAKEPWKLENHPCRTLSTDSGAPIRDSHAQHPVCEPNGHDLYPALPGQWPQHPSLECCIDN